MVQIALIVLALVLIFMYIRPTFANIGVVQDELYRYQEAVDNAEEFNHRLAELVLVENSFSDSDMEALALFLPDKLDAAQIMRDLEVIAELYNVEINKMIAGTPETFNPNIAFENRGEVSVNSLVSQDFSIDVTGPNIVIKKTLALIEANAYPLEVVEMSVVNVPDEDSDAESDESLLAIEDNFNLKLILRAYAMDY